jgi:hypothetical protein
MGATRPWLQSRPRAAPTEPGFGRAFSWFRITRIKSVLVPILQTAEG